MRLTLAALAAAVFLCAIPTVQAQTQPTPGQAQAAIQTPHEVTLELGENPFVFRVIAVLGCTAGFEGPAPLQVRVGTGAVGPDDGEGAAWTFAETSWNFTWEQPSAGNYSIDEEFTVTIDAAGHGDRGHFGEFSIGTVAVRDASDTSCTATGYSVPARSGHAHISVGPRPAAAEDKGSPGPGVAAGALALVAALALARRRA